MAKQSAGILLYQLEGQKLKLFLVHPGGPYWAKKDMGAWSIPKGEYTEEEQPLDAAVREFQEETGQTVKDISRAIDVGEIKMSSGKRVHAWAVEQDINPAQLKSNVFEIEWPPKSGRMKMFPEADRGDWFSVAQARQKIHQSQLPFIDTLLDELKISLESQIEEIPKPDDPQLTFF
jgi:predicted NUDIX family NTP pyrophosphohydrolase